MLFGAHTKPSDAMYMWDEQAKWKHICSFLECLGQQRFRGQNIQIVINKSKLETAEKLTDDDIIIFWAE